MATTVYRILPIIGGSPYKGTPIVWGTQYFPEGLKAQNLSFYFMVSDLTLLSRLVPLLGRLRYILESIQSIICKAGYDEIQRVFVGR